MPSRPPVHRPIAAQRPGITPRQTDPFYGSVDWKKLRRFVLERDGYRCRVRLPGCTRLANTADHIVARTQGGRDDAANLRAACPACHNRRHPEKGGGQR